ncbi:MAG: NTP transferase domain-containing protein [Nitrosopumilaceae archaeon]|nr:NTP transferase domain-containing protein [Nitrosopumilaceae archaeon]
MAGGKGSRMTLPKEKLLLEYKKPVILHVLDALQNSNCFSKIIAVTSPNSPNTRNLLLEKPVDIFDSLGDGYVEDLNSLLRKLDEPVLVTSGDLPFLDDKIIKKILEFYDENTWTSIVVTKGFLDSLGLSSEFFVECEGIQCHYTGISLINSKKIKSLETISENYKILDDKRIAFNLNTKKDFDLLSTT